MTTTAHRPTAAVTAPPTTSSPSQGGQAPMTHRQILEALSGLLLGMFVAILSSTVVSNALPTILPALGGDESGYTWVVTASLLATTISTPIWGKLADILSKKVLVQASLVIFAVSSIVAGLSVNVPMLIACRVGQGLGAGGLTALAQIMLATMISPRERGRYSGYLGATFALATVGGPLIGGVLTQHLSWHYTFYVGVPFAVAAFIVIQKTLNLPAVAKRTVHIDYWGATLLAAGVSALLIWVSLAGKNFAWVSWQTAVLVGGGVLLLVAMVFVERRSREPIIPLHLFRSPTTVLASIASLFVGVAMFGATIFLSQYFQLARGDSPTQAGLSTMPMILGLFLSSTVVGQLVTRTGRWKRWIVTGGVLLTSGVALMGTVAWNTPYWIVAIFMALVGLGVGMMMQNLVLAVQNVTDPKDMGTASSFVAFTRTLGGAIGVSALGAFLSHRVAGYLVADLKAAGVDPAAAGSVAGSGGVPVLSEIPQPVRTVVQTAFGAGIADIFLVAAPFALLSLLFVLFFKETALRTSNAPRTSHSEDDDEQRSSRQRESLHHDDAHHDDVHHGKHAAPVEPAMGDADHLGRHADRRVPLDAHH
ncbi:drug resistance transporter, EmrB/QacA subfamily [Quadrisphaera granulorum]|uniref:EmrB/QacA subfamily drug resistance transporter n=1 Tax=Quadrisphaera granulorum TaxID=317664 RepID=A0A315ZL14_9ACTN|nr:MDR family MFS transporter [Quadrisphaera granulorum]PWJ46305.1 EmrB/QacA subfamily drug resistance transporter [Quadrisphaera granulorum]SZE99066.1 drug resistance transporter, EmrB/QacA subfamily [Quadrisphaera granulorum]